MGERWIKLYSKLTEWQWYTDGCTMRLFVHLLLTARADETMCRGVAVPAGCRMTNINQLAAETGMNAKSIRKAISNLEKTGEISIERDANGDWLYIVRISKWETYQPQKKSQTPTANHYHEPLPLTPTENGRGLGQPLPLTPTTTPTENGRGSDKEKVNKEKTEVDKDKRNDCTCPSNHYAHDACAEDTHNNEFSNFSSSIDPYPRTTDEVKTAAALQGIAMTDEEARAFIDYNASVGWMARGEPIRKWKALLNGWHQKELLRERRNQSGNGTKWDSRYVSKDYSHVVSDEIA